MFDPTSRYAKVAVKQWTDAQGRVRAHVGRRIIPEGQEIAGQAKVQPGDRLDLIANRTYGDPRAWWRIPDANPDPEPLKLADEAGRKLKVALVKPE